jgi:galactose-1-phosphate uridylyltransferase
MMSNNNGSLNGEDHHLYKFRSQGNSNILSKVIEEEREKNRKLLNEIKQIRD